VGAISKEAEEFIVGWAREWIICLASANVAGGYLIDSPFRRLVEESFSFSVGSRIVGV
jgi:hypothetical protein